MANTNRSNRRRAGTSVVPSVDMVTASAEMPNHLIENDLIGLSEIMAMPEHDFTGSADVLNAGDVIDVAHIIESVDSTDMLTESPEFAAAMAETLAARNPRRKTMSYDGFTKFDCDVCGRRSHHRPHLPRTTCMPCIRARGITDDDNV